MGNKGKVRKIAIIGITAAVYAVLTIFIPFGYLGIQCRLSEIMNLLVFFNPIFAPGIVLGCLHCKSIFADKPFAGLDNRRFFNRLLCLFYFKVEKTTCQLSLSDDFLRFACWFRTFHCAWAGTRFSPILHTAVKLWQANLLQ